MCIFAVITLAMFTGILVFGLRPKDFTTINQVSLLDNKKGVRVGKYNTLYAQNIFKEINSNTKPPNEFTIELALLSLGTATDGFRFIALFHAGDDSGQMLVGQWRTSIVIMNGDDYDNRRKTPKIYIKNSLKLTLF